MNDVTPVVRFQPSGRTLRLAPGATLLDAARQAGLPIASACQGEALCARCAVRVSGEGELPPESAAEALAKRRNRVSSDLRLACQVAPTCDVEVSASYW